MQPVDYQNIGILDKSDNLFDLSGKVGIILGGAGRMGKEFAGVLSKSGAQLVLADINEKALEDAKSKLAAEQNKTETAVRRCDVTSHRDVEQLFEGVDKEYGRLDFLICNTMAKPNGYYKPFEEYPQQTWDQVLQGNLTGTFLCCQQAYKFMKKRQRGSIVITSSVYGMVSPDFRIYKDCSPIRNPYGGHDPLTAPVPYSASKGGLIALSKYLAVLFGPDNIRVNTFTPAGVYDDHEEAFHNAYINRVPLGRMAVWSDYNGAILFLVSEASRYMTGSNLVIDGGWTAW